MSRTFYEWQKAKWAWMNDQHFRRVDIPIPGKDSIVYNRSSDNSYWESRRQNALSQIPSSLHFTFEDNRIESFIRSAALQERMKEEAFLDQFYRDDGKGANESMIDKFNIMFQSRAIYEDYNRRIKEILDIRQNQQNKTYTDANGATHEYFTGLAPNLSSVFLDYFITHFRRRLTSNKVPTTQAEFNDMIERAALGASRQMVNIQPENANEHGWGQEWQPVLNALERGGPEKEWFMSTLRNAIGESNLTKLYNNIKGKNKVNIKRKQLVADLKVTNQNARVGGSIVEVVTAMFANAFNVSNESFQMYAQNFGASTEMTDMMQLWSLDLNIDLTRAMNELQQSMTGLGSDEMRQMYQRIQNWYNQQGKNMEKLWMVYTNAKNKGIGADGTDVTKSYHGDLEELPNFLNANGIPVDNAEDFLAFAYNTAEGAIRESSQGWLEQNLVNALKAAAAKIMFDDYQSIGQGDANAIHMYYLSGKYIPSSFVLNAMADAAAESNINSKAQVILPDTIEDNGPIWPEFDSRNDAEFKEALWEHWQEEYERAKSASKWSMFFTLKIKAILGNAI